VQEARSRISRESGGTRPCASPRSPHGALSSRIRGERIAGTRTLALWRNLRQGRASAQERDSRSATSRDWGDPGAGRPAGQARARSSISAARRCAQVAQLVEQRTENPCVGGSIPPLGTFIFQLFRRRKRPSGRSRLCLSRLNEIEAFPRFSNGSQTVIGTKVGTRLGAGCPHAAAIHEGRRLSAMKGLRPHLHAVTARKSPQTYFGATSPDRNPFKD
jgi:hypothetical protein